jgi:hypothetical protein
MNIQNIQKILILNPIRQSILEYVKISRRRRPELFQYANPHTTLFIVRALVSRLVQARSRPYTTDQALREGPPNRHALSSNLHRFCP